MADPSAAGESRRRFLRRVGTTLAAGVGLAAFGADRSGARPHRGTNACAIFCTPLCGQQPCPAGQNYFSCDDRCSGPWKACLSHACSSYCFSQYAC